MFRSAPESLQRNRTFRSRRAEGVAVERRVPFRRGGYRLLLGVRWLRKPPTVKRQLAAPHRARPATDNMPAHQKHVIKGNVLTRITRRVPGSIVKQVALPVGDGVLVVIGQ